MAAPAAQPRGNVLRRAAERLLDLADRLDTPANSLKRVEQLHDDIETTAAEIRAVVRGPQHRPVNPPLFLEVDGDGTARAAW